MPVNPADFKAAYPEFQDADDNLVWAFLGYAGNRTPSAVWGTFQDEGTYLWCAKLLAESPFARKIGLVDARNGGETAYDARLTALIRSVAPRWMVV